MEVGKKLREIRKSKGFTLLELSKQTGLSVSFLSNIERDVNSPTLTSINKILETMDFSIVDFLSSSEQQPKILTKRHEFETVFTLKSGTKYELALCGNQIYKCICMTLAPTCYEPEFSLGLPEDNLAIVTKGMLQLEINGTVYAVDTEDILFVPGNVPHSYRKLTDSECVIYWFALQPMGSG